MAVSVAELRRLFGSSGPDFEVSAALLGFDAAARLCEAYLGGESLEISGASYDLATLVVRGKVAIAGVQRCARVRFLDGPGDTEPVVSGVEVVAEAAGWVVEEPLEAAADLSAWQAMGFSSACAFLSAGAGVPGIDCGDGTAYGVGPGVGFQVGGTREYARVLTPDVYGVVNLSADFAAGLSLGSAESLGSLPFLKDLAITDLELPPPVSDVLSAISLRSASVAYRREPFALQRTEVVLGVKPDSPPWTLIPGFLELEVFDGLTLAAVREEGPWRLSARLGARFAVGDHRMHASVSLPDQRVSAVLWHPADTDALIGEHLEGTGLDTGSVEVRSLRVECDIRSKSYTLALALDTAWTPVTGITLEQIELRLAGQASRAVSEASLLGRFELAGTPVVLEGFKDGPVWGVRGAASGIGLTDFAGWFADLFGESLPPVADDMEPSLVSVSFDSARSGRVEVRGHLPLSDTWLDFTLVASVSEESGVRRIGFGAEVRTEVTVDGAPRLIVFQGAITAGSGTRLRLSWEMGETGEGVPLLGLAQGLGLPVEELRELWPVALQPTLRSVGITYDGAAGSTVVAAESAQGVVVFASMPDPQVPGSSVSLLQVGVDVEAGLSDVPLLGGSVPAGADLRLTRVRGVYASRDVPVAVMDRVNALVAEAGPALPLFPRPAAGPGQVAGVLRRGAVLLVDYRVPGGTPESLMVSLSFAPSGAAGVRAAPATSGTVRPMAVEGGAGEATVGDVPTDAPGAVPGADAGAPGPTFESGAPTAGPAVDDSSAAPPSAPAVPAPVEERRPSVPDGPQVFEGVVLAPGDPPAPAAPDRPGVWVEIGRSFGPLMVRRVGLAYDKGVVWFMVDGALTASGFTMSVDGLALGVDLDAAGFPVRTRLAGLGVEFVRAPLRIAGALLDRTPPPAGFTMMVAGMLVVQMPRFGVTAVGAYQRREKDGMVSLFVFGRGTLALGGPPPFRVTGVAAGFGFNSSLKIPGPSEVSTFPLLGELDSAQPTDPMAMLDDLAGTWVSARQGGLWLAAGLDFTSFEFITGRLLLILETGDGLTLALVGAARAAFPPTGRAYAQVQLQLRIVYSSTRAEFAATALLYDSYLIDPACVLTGGFAFHMWFEGSGHPGDFALTVGGYHPEYKAPDHYPQVPRLGFSWSLGSISITGTSFFALTPSAVMAGGTLDVRYSSGALNAWFSAYAHLLISWKPFHFRVGIGVSLGASLKVWFATLRAELSASLDLWGPSTGGRVTAKFTFVRVTVSFGPGETKPKALDWSAFTELLPPAGKVLRIAASEGLLADAEPPEGRDAQDPDAPWLVDASGFTFVAETSVPASSVVFQDRVPDTGGALDIRPMQRSGLTSSFTVRVTRNTAARGATPRWEAPADDGAWHAGTVLGEVPTALWGPPNLSSHDLLDPDKRLLPGRRTGLRVTVPPPVSTGTPLPPIKESALKYEDLDDASNGPVGPGDPPTGDEVRLAVGTGVGTVAGTIATQTTATARTRLAAVLAALLDPLPDAPLSAFVTHANENGLPADPLLFAAGAEGGAGWVPFAERPRPVATP